MFKLNFVKIFKKKINFLSKNGLTHFTCILNILYTKYVYNGKKQKNLNTKVIQHKKKWFDRIFILKRRGPFRSILYIQNTTLHIITIVKSKKKKKESLF